jgi:hypothetical protein
MESAEHRQADDLATAVGRRRSSDGHELPEPLVRALLEVPNVFG